MLSSINLRALNTSTSLGFREFKYVEAFSEFEYEYDMAIDPSCFQSQFSARGLTLREYSVMEGNS